MYHFEFLLYNISNMIFSILCFSTRGESTSWKELWTAVMWEERGCRIYVLLMIPQQRRTYWIVRKVGTRLAKWIAARLRRYVLTEKTILLSDRLVGHSEMLNESLFLGFWQTLERDQKKNCIWKSCYGQAQSHLVWSNGRPKHKINVWILSWCFQLWIMDSEGQGRKAHWCFWNVVREDVACTSDREKIQYFHNRRVLCRETDFHSS